MAQGKIQTVTGLISPEDVGVTMAHEHLAISFSVSYLPPASADQGKELLEVNLPNLGWIRQHPVCNKSNLVIDPKEEYDAIVEEMKFYKVNGGSTIVDNTTLGIARDVKYLRSVSETTGVNILAGAGYYVDASHPSSMSTMTEEDLIQQLQDEILEGCDGTNIKAGVIGELGCSWPLTTNEEKVLRAAAAAQVATGCPVIIHPGRNRDAPFEIMRIYQEAGGDVSRVVMSHLDRTIQEKEDLETFSAIGCYCEWDLFGVEVSHYDLDPHMDMLSDAQRIERIKWVIDEGHADKITIGHDVHTKHRLMKYGGHGFSHILLNVKPKMLARGLTQEHVDNILINNPTKWLTFK